MMQRRLFIARHGETEYNRKQLLQGRGIDASLNETGVQQAKELSDYLSSYPVQYLGSSSLRRSYETAGYHGKSIEKDVVQYAGLDEMDYGDFEGASFPEVEKEIKQISRSWRSGDVDLRIPGGESPKDTFDRANSAMMELMESTGEETIAVVIHGRLIRILLSEWLGLGLRNMHKIDHQNGSVNQLVYKNGRFEAVYLNKTDHLTL
jgi:probable phosphoglycerate mutase